MIVRVICTFYTKYIFSSSNKNIRLDIMGIFGPHYNEMEFKIALRSRNIIPEEFKSTESIYKLYCLGRRPIRMIFLRKIR